MKRTLIFLLFTGLLCCLSSQVSYAQYMPEADSVYTSRGQGLVDAGKTLMFTGASCAVTGLALFVAGTLTFEQEECCPVTPIYPVFALAGGALGAAMALIGLPFYTGGNKKMEKNGGLHFTFDKGYERGLTGIIDLGLGIAESLSLDALCGYDFNRNIFLGGGIGYRTFLGSAREYEGVTAAVPVFANARFSFGDKRTVPYISPSLGYDLFYSDIYLALDTGTRFRCLNNEKGASWWLGTKMEFIGKEMSFLSLKLGRSF